MEILGEIKEGFILTASRSELARLIGYGYSSSVPQGTLKIGAEIKVHDMYARLYYISGNRVKIEQIIQHLREIIQRLEIVSPLVTAAEGIEIETD